jgi:hypothetical protein
MRIVIRRLRIQTYREQLAACNQVRVALSTEIQNLELPQDELLSIGHRLDKATKESLSLQVILDHLERQEKEDQTGRQFRSI